MLSLFIGLSMVARMTFLSFIKQKGLFFVLAATAFAGVSCNKSHDEAKKVDAGESQLELPEMSVEEKKVADKRLDWNMATLYDAYEKIGSRDKKWDREAREGLKFFAQSRSYPNLKGFPEMLGVYTRRAVELGCDDPMVKYLRVRFDSDQMTPLQVAQACATASDALENSQYGEVRKFYGAIRAINAYLKVKPWRQEGIIYRDRAQQHLLALLEDKQIPISEIDDAAHEGLVIINRWGDQQPFDQMDALLLKNWANYPVTYLLEGEFYIKHAWKARGSGYADTVKPEQWKLFGERLELAEKALLKGMEVDPKDGRLPSEMITVVSAQSKGLPEMRHWWEMAMEANPNNYAACSTLLNFLLPRWYGSREAMIEFGRECVASDKFGGTVPLILADAHYSYMNHDVRDDKYWLLPDVWPDIKSSFEKFFALNPKAISWRHNYARYAYWCQQWDVLQEQIGLMGDEINYSYFGGRDKYDEMVKLAAGKGSTNRVPESLK